MLKLFLKNNFWIILAIIATIMACASIYNVVIWVDNKQENIAKNGIAVNAEVVSSSMVQEGDAVMFEIEYRFTDENGNVHEGKTGLAYYYEEIEEYLDSKIIPVRYDPVTFESVEEFFEISNFLIVLSIGASLLVCLICAVFWLQVFVWGNKNIRNKKIKTSGTEYVAEVVFVKYIGSVNEKHYYGLTYSWIDEDGVKRNGDATKYFYNKDQFDEIDKSRKIGIRAIGKYSLIDDSIDIRAVEVNRRTKKCSYCGTLFTDSTCPNCGVHIDDNE